MKRKLLFIAFCVFFTYFEATASPGNNPESSDTSPRGTIEFLSNLGSRIPGYEGNAKAADYIYEIFSELGLEELRREELPVTVPVDKGASLKGPGGARIELYCLWPNMVRTPTLPREGVKGKLIYGGKGEYKDFNGYELENAVVVLEFNCGKNWLKAAELGARAIIFVEPEETMRIEAERKCVEVPINVPRFMLPREKFELIKNMEGHDVTLKANMQWQKVPTWNIFGLIPGKDEKLSQELIAISAYYDSISVVPMKAPGAESACGIAALIEIAKDLRKNPPDRSVLILATSGHFMGLRGIDDFMLHCRELPRELEGMMKEPIKINLFIGLDLYSQNNEIGVFHQGDYFRQEVEPSAFYYQRLFAPFGKKFEVYAGDICTDFGIEVDDIFVNGISPKKGINWLSYIPDDIALDSEIAVLSGTPAISLVTVNDIRNRVNTPIDSGEKVNVTNLSTQVKFLKLLIRKALNDSTLFPESKMELEDKLYTLTGTIVTFNPRKSFVPNDPVNSAIAFIRRPLVSLMGVRGSFYELTDENGEFTISRLPGATYQMEGYGIDPQDGEIILAPDRGVGGDLSYPMELAVDWKVKRQMVVLFPCVSTDIYDLVDPRYLTRLTHINVFDITNSTPFVYGYSTDEIIWGTLPRTSDVCPYAVIFSEPGKKLKVGMASSILGLRMLLLNSPGTESKDMAEGIGYDVNQCRRIIRSPFRAAQDMLNLNEYRMKELAKYGIVNNRLDDLHMKAKAAIEEAEKAKEGKKWDYLIYIDLKQSFLLF